MKKRYVYTLVFLLAAVLVTLAYADQAVRYEATYGRFNTLTVTNAVDMSDATISDAGDITTASIGGGTALTGLLHTTVTVDNGATTNTTALAGITTDYRILATINSGNTNDAHITQTDVAAGLVSVEISADPGADTVVSILAIK